MSNSRRASGAGGAARPSALLEGEAEGVGGGAGLALSPIADELRQQLTSKLQDVKNLSNSDDNTVDGDNTVGSGSNTVGSDSNTVGVSKSSALRADLERLLAEKDRLVQEENFLEA